MRFKKDAIRDTRKLAKQYGRAFTVDCINASDDFVETLEVGPRGRVTVLDRTHYSLWDAPLIRYAVANGYK